MEDIKKYIQIIEDTPPEIEYERTDDKVTANLKSYDSAAYTRLAKKVLQMQELENQIKQLKNEVKEDTRIYVADLFDAEDAVKTRVVNTIKFILTLSKDPKPTNTIKYAKVLEELEKELTPELIMVLNSLKEKFTTIIQKSPSLKIEPNNESIEIKPKDRMKSFTKKFLQFIRSWGNVYDEKLENLMQSVG